VIVAERDGAVLRHASENDLTAIDALTVAAYGPIQDSFVAMLGPDLYEAVFAEPERTWDERKCAQNRELFAKSPDQVWVLDDGEVFGYVSFWLFRERGYGHLDNNAVAAGRTGQGWATFMYRAVLERFRELSLQWAHVDTHLDDAHVPARRAYEAVGFDRAVPAVDLWQRL
jgi:GNAT superfamily N-acetyltransferase